MSKTIVITGAADGLGKALSLKCIAQGHRVIAVDKDLDSLQKLTAVNFRPVHLDLTRTDEFSRLMDVLAGDKIDVLVHCAGISATGKFQDIPMANHRLVTAVNLTAPMVLTNHLLHHNALSDRANITLISSLSHFLGYPGASSYAASKDGLAHFGKSLQKACPRMRILRVFPGPIDTDHAKRYAPDNSAKAIGNRMDADQAALIIWRSIERRHRTCVPGLPAKLGAFAGRVAPTLMGRVLRRTLLDKMDRVRT